MSQATIQIAISDHRHRAHVGPSRLNPSRSDSRYYILTLLRREMERFVIDHVKGKNIDTLIDFGCGEMPYRPLLAPHVRRYVGADLQENEHADATVDADGRVDMPDRCAGVVLSSQVLEHVSDPSTHLNEARRLLCNNGLLVISTHGVWKHHPHPLDLWRWTSQGIKQILTECGFDALSSRGLMGLAPTGLLLLQDALLDRFPKRAKPMLAWPMQRLMAAADILHSRAERDRDACVYFVVARRID